MTFAQGRYQPDTLHGPQWRPAPLAGIRMAGAAADGLQLTGVLAQVPVLGAVSQAPAAGCLSGRRPARTA
jgi:hypothetical protein